MKSSLYSPIVTLNDRQLSHRSKIFAAIKSGELDFQPSTCSCDGGASKIDIKIASRDAWGFPIPTVVCMSCGLVRSSFIQSEQSMKRFYEKFYYPHMFTSSSHEGDIGMDKVDYVEEEVGRGQRIMELFTQSGTQNFESKDILDVGCGAGGSLSVFEEKGANCYGVDFNSENINYAIKKFPSMKFLVGGAEQFPGLSFDMIFICDVLEHVTEPRMFLAQVLSRLKPGGVVYINSPGLHGICNWRFNCTLREFLKIEHTYCYTRANLARIMRDVGFQVDYISESVECIASRPAVTGSRESNQMGLPVAAFTILLMLSLPVRKWLKIDRALFDIRKRIS